MRHRRLGRTLGRNSSHRRAMFRNLASALFLTERDAEYDFNKPKIPGRIITTLEKAKEIRPIVERCITLARRSAEHQREAAKYATPAKRGSEEWKNWRSSDLWQKWSQAMAPSIALRRRALEMLGDKKAVKVLFDTIGPRFATRNGGYTRILRLAKPRLGDAGTRAILEFVGTHDRVIERSERPAFDAGATSETT